LKAIADGSAGSDSKFYQAKLQTARFYFAKLLPETLTLMATARSGAAVLMDTDEVFA
jgi:Acetyl-CoA dehydrogenase C-terminal like